MSSQNKTTLPKAIHKQKYTIWYMTLQNTVVIYTMKFLTNGVSEILVSHQKYLTTKRQKQKKKM